MSAIVHCQRYLGHTIFRGLVVFPYSSQYTRTNKSVITFLLFVLVVTVGIEQKLFEYQYSIPKGTLGGLWVAYWLWTLSSIILINIPIINGNRIGDD
jgi:hypothetical protein